MNRIERKAAAKNAHHELVQSGHLAAANQVFRLLRLGTVQVSLNRDGIQAGITMSLNGISCDKALRFSI